MLNVDHMILVTVLIYCSIQNFNKSGDISLKFHCNMAILDFQILKIFTFTRH